jgi:hypothetical protein
VTTHRAVGALAALSIAAVMLTSCGSKPSYCSTVSNIQKSIQSLNLSDLASPGATAVPATVQKIENEITTAVSQAKSDFPKQTSALSSSMTALSNSIKQLSASPSATEIAAVVANATSTVTAVKNLASAVSSKCS